MAKKANTNIKQVQKKTKKLKGAIIGLSVGLLVASSAAIAAPLIVLKNNKKSDDQSTKQFTITFEDGFDPSSPVITTEKVEINALAKMPLPEHRSNVGFLGWKEVKEGTPGSDNYPYFDFMNTPITQDYKLYGYWRREADPDTNGEAFNCSVNETGDGVIINSLKKDYFIDSATGANKVVDVVVPDKIKIDGQYLPVVGIGMYNNGTEDCGAFQDYENWARIGYNFHSISLPDTIKYFDTTAFRENESLRILNMPKNLERVGSNCFQSCVKLADIKFYDKLEVIEAGAFSGNAAGSTDSYIRSLDLPSSLKFIGRGAFGLNAIQTLNLSKCNNLILGDGAFENAINLKEITLPEGLPYIPAECFKLCTRFRKINIPKSVKYIEQYAFSGCYRLRNVEIENDSELLFIEEGTFCECFSLEKINFQEKIKSIGPGAFNSCSNLISVGFEKARDWYVNGEGEAWSTSSKDHTPLENAKKLLECGNNYSTFEVESVVDSGIKYLTDDGTNCFVVGTTEDFTVGEVTIPNQVKIGEGESAKQYNVVGIGTKAFKGKTNITSIKFNSTTPEKGSPIEYIYNSAFEECLNIQSIDFSNCKNLTTIGDYAFYNAFGAEVSNEATAIDFTACEKLSSIGDYAFSFPGVYEHENVGEITSVILPSALTHLGNGAFYNQKKITSFKFCPDNATSNLKEIGNDEDSILSSPIINSSNTIESIDMSKCTQLEYLPLAAFQGNTGLKSITLSESLKYIYDYAFEGCSALEEIIIPEKCEYIGYQAFKTPALKNANFKNGNWLVKKGAVKNTIAVGSSAEDDAKNLAETYTDYFWLKI